MKVSKGFLNLVVVLILGLNLFVTVRGVADSYAPASYADLQLRIQEYEHYLEKMGFQNIRSDSNHPVVAARKIAAQVFGRIDQLGMEPGLQGRIAKVLPKLLIHKPVMPSEELPAEIISIQDPDEKMASLTNYISSSVAKLSMESSHEMTLDLMYILYGPKLSQDVVLVDSSLKAMVRKDVSTLHPLILEYNKFVYSDLLAAQVPWLGKALSILAVRRARLNHNKSFEDLLRSQALLHGIRFENYVSSRVYFLNDPKTAALLADGDSVVARYNPLLKEIIVGNSPSKSSRGWGLLSWIAGSMSIDGILVTNRALVGRSLSFFEKAKLWINYQLIDFQNHREEGVVNIFRDDDLKIESAWVVIGQNEKNGKFGPFGLERFSTPGLYRSLSVFRLDKKLHSVSFPQIKRADLILSFFGSLYSSELANSHAYLGKMMAEAYSPDQVDEQLTFIAERVAQNPFLKKIPVAQLTPTSNGPLPPPNALASYETMFLKINNEKENPEEYREFLIRLGFMDHSKVMQHNLTSGNYAN